MTNLIIAHYEDGTLSDAEALWHLASNLGEVEDSIAPLEAERKALRETIQSITARLGGKASVPGFGSLAITAGGETVSYDAKALDSLTASLLATGDVELVRIAAQIAQARKVSQRSGGLRITRER